MKLSFGSYTPDTPNLGFAGDEPDMIDAKNVIPAKEGYKPLPALAAYTNALNARCQGAFSTKDDSGTSHTYAGTATKLYLLTTATFTDATRSSGGAYACPADSQWRFVKYGNSCIAVNGSDAVQVIAMVAGTNFTALAGSPPSAVKFIAVVREFVVLGNSSAANATVTWSGSNSSITWTAGTLESGSQQLYEGGKIQGMLGGEVGIIFQERNITRMVRAPAPLSWQFDTIEQGRGVLAPYSIVPVGPGVFYLGQDGFYLLTGNGSQAIGVDQVDRSFFNDVNTSYIDRVSAANDPINKLVFIVYPSTASSTGTPDKCLIWNWGTSPAKWSYGVFDTEVLMQQFAQGVTLEGLDAYSSSLDALTISLDADIWKGGKLQLGAFDTSHKLGFFNGSSMSATLTTLEAQLNDKGRAFVNQVVPLIDCTDATIAMGTRERQGDNATFGSEATIHSITGICNLRSSGRFHRARMTIPSASVWSYAQGVDIPPQGIRTDGRR